MLSLENKTILITKPENIYYLTGFQGSFAQLIKTPKNLFLLTDARYQEEVKKLPLFNTPDLTTIIIEDYLEDLQSLFTKLKLKTLYFESNHLTYAQFLSFTEKLQDFSPKITLKPLTNEVDYLRMVKSEDEIQKIRESQMLTIQVYETIKKLLKPGITEQETARKIISIAYDLGADDLAFSPIVAFAKNSASVHAIPTNKKLSKTDNILLDMGFKLNNYCSDLSRTILPENPSNEMQNIYNLVQEAQTNCITNIKAGMSGIEADLLSRKVFEQEGLDEFFPHANGHGVGLEIHEAPSLSPKAKHKDRKIILEPNMVVTVEPGLYLPEKFGVRIEDVVVIGENSSRMITE